MTAQAEIEPLQGHHIVTLAVNAPGPVAAARLRAMGATVVKLEPPTGDPVQRSSPAWYAALCAGQDVRRIDLKDAAGRAALDDLLADADLLLTSSRPAALDRLGLAWSQLHTRFPRLAQVAIVGHPTPHDDAPGHDLTYLAQTGLLTPPGLPRTLMADLMGAERAVSAALGLLLARERGRAAGYTQVALADAAVALADPLRYGLTGPGGILGGGFAGYNLYRACDGWIAVAALEPHFWQRLVADLTTDAGHPGHADRSGHSGTSPTWRDLEPLFAARTAAAWEAWAAARDLPLVAVRDAPI